MPRPKPKTKILFGPELQEVVNTFGSIQGLIDKQNAHVVRNLLATLKELLKECDRSHWHKCLGHCDRCESRDVFNLRVKPLRDVLEKMDV